MSLRPDHTAADLRALMDQFATAAKPASPTAQANQIRQQLQEARPAVMRHRGDKTIRVVKKGGVPIGEIGTDSDASAGNGAYYVKLYNGSYNAVGFDTAEEALAELKYAVKQMSEGRADRNEMDTPAVQSALARMRQRHEKEPFDLKKAQALGQKLAARNRDPRRK